MRFFQSLSSCFVLACLATSFMFTPVVFASGEPNPSATSETVQDSARSLKREATFGENFEDLSPWLKDIPLKTRRSGILPEEYDLYYKILSYASEVDSKQIKKAARKFLTQRWSQSKYKKQSFEKFPIFVDMYQHPQIYQGRPITMTGHIQRSVVSKADANEFGIDTICEAWLYTEDSQSNPTVIISTNFPKNFPVGEQVVDHVTVTGYAYRMYTYDARDSRRFAPLIMAHEIKWIPKSKFGEENRPLQGLLILMLIILVLGGLLGGILLKLYNVKSRSKINVAQMLSENSQPSFDFEKED
ncbi:MAG: hypothetical protein JKY95_00555 [Planctomycetaceae bacterium]|nr:hypothetical protein [Planctomycetaceae bacterium]